MKYEPKNQNVAKLPKSTLRGTVSASRLIKRIPAIFFQTEAGSEPVRSWLNGMAREDRRLIGEDIKSVEFGWPIGMPTCRPLGDGLWEVRTDLQGNRISRVFYVDTRQRMVLLHGILKKTRATPPSDLDMARKQMRKHEKGLK